MPQRVGSPSARWTKVKSCSRMWSVRSAICFFKLGFSSAVAAWCEALQLPASRLVVVHDDLDLPLGRLRVVGRAGPGGHRGVASIQETLGTQAIPRVRVGIGRPREGEDAAERVLEEFTPEELPVVEEMVGRAAEAVRTLISSGLAAAMDRYNVRAPASEASPCGPTQEDPQREEGR